DNAFWKLEMTNAASTPPASGAVHPGADLKPIKIGLLGLGVVGGGTWSVLTRNAEEIARRAGRRIEISRVAVRNVAKARGRIGESIPVDTDVRALVSDASVDIVVELIGGDTLARELVL